jgi:hypothetical protein
MVVGIGVGVETREVTGDRVLSLASLVQLATVASVRRLFLGGCEASWPSFVLLVPEVGDEDVRAGRLTRLRIPGTLSGPRRFGAASYSQTLLRRTQFWHDGRELSHRILRPRL